MVNRRSSATNTTAAETYIVDALYVLSLRQMNIMP